MIARDRTRSRNRDSRKIPVAKIGTCCLLAVLTIGIVAGWIPGSKAIALPPNVSRYIPITITNNQNSATSTPFQQMITLDSSTFSSLEAPNLQNIEFFLSDGTPVPSWLESGNSTATSTIYWLKLPVSIAGQSSLTIYMGFASQSTTLFDGQIVGGAASLSSSYGQYDNGANVFNFYDSFKGSSLSTNWKSYVPSGGSLTVNNGLTIAGPSGTFCGYNVNTEIDSNSTGAQFTGPSVLDVNFAIGPSSSNFRFGFRDTGLCDLQDGFAGHGYAVDYSYPTNTQLTSTNGGNGIYNPSCDTVASGWTCALGKTPVNNPTIFTIAASSSAATYSQNYQRATSVTIGTNAPSFSSSIGIGLEENYFANPVHVAWVRTRALPPNGVMPSATTLQALASVTRIQGYSPLTVSLTGSASGGTPPYSYSWNFGDNNSSNTQRATHTYKSAGVYSLALNVTDSSGTTSIFTVQITVTDPPVSTSSNPTPASALSQWWLWAIVGLSVLSAALFTSTIQARRRIRTGEATSLKGNMLVCPNCKATMPPASSFCGRCGHKFDNDQQHSERS